MTGRSNDQRAGDLFHYHCHLFATKHLDRAHRQISFLFFFNDTPTTEIYTLSLHDALPIWVVLVVAVQVDHAAIVLQQGVGKKERSEEHTSELQSPCNLVCRLLLEKKK